MTTKQSLTAPHAGIAAPAEATSAQLPYLPVAKPLIEEDAITGAVDRVCLTIAEVLARARR